MTLTCHDLKNMHSKVERHKLVEIQSSADAKNTILDPIILKIWAILIPAKIFQFFYTPN
jgi:hypothetical protein